jgi:phage recombination protein Bet
MNQQLTTTTPARLPMPENLPEAFRPKWRVLTEAIFPNAKTADGIMLAVEYCQARGLDIMKRPVHVVPVWSKAKRGFIENVWPSINEIQVTAARTNAWAGMDRPEFGPAIRLKLTGDKTSWDNREQTTQQVTIDLEVPEWCEVTVWRLVQGIRCSFCEPVYWREAYARLGQNSELPTDMWIKRPRGQLLKVAKAFSLRAAFPEEAEYSAEEMAGQTLDDDVVPTTLRPSTPPAPAPGLKPQAPPPHDPETGEIKPPHEIEVLFDANDQPETFVEWAMRFVAAVRTSGSVAEIAAWNELNADKIIEIKETEPKTYTKLEAATNAHRIRLEAT